MKTAWLINHYTQVPGGVGGTRHYSLAKKLQKLGWQVDLIAASVEHNTGRQRLSSGIWKRLDVADGIKVLWLWTPTYAGSGIKRTINMLSFTIALLTTRLTNDLAKPDVIIGSSVHPFAAWAAMQLAQRHHVPFIFEVRDLWPETLVEMGRLKRDGLTARFFYWLEKKLYQRADKIIVLLPSASNYISALGIDVDKILYLPNAPDLDFFPPPVIKSIKTGEPFQLVYFGSHGPANDLENVLKALALLKERRPDLAIAVRMIGDGPSKPALSRACFSVAGLAL